MGQGRALQQQKRTLAILLGLILVLTTFFTTNPPSVYAGEQDRVPDNTLDILADDAQQDVITLRFTDAGTAIITNLWTSPIIVNGGNQTNYLVPANLTVDVAVLNGTEVTIQESANDTFRIWKNAFSYGLARAVSCEVAAMPTINAFTTDTAGTTAGANFFRQFNLSGSITNLPIGSFDTSSITTAGEYFFAGFNSTGSLKSLPEGSFNTSKITSASACFFSNFNYSGSLKSLPDGSFNTSKITSANDSFFDNFNAHAANLTSLPAGSFDISNITSTSSRFFFAFNSSGSISSLPADSFNTANITSAGYDFFCDFNGNGSLTQGNKGVVLVNNSDKAMMFFSAGTDLPDIIPSGAKVYINADPKPESTIDRSAIIFAGKDRYDTAAQVALAAYPSGAKGVIVAAGSGTDRFDGKYPDALAASALAGLLDYPIMLTGEDNVSTYSLNAIKKLNPDEIIVLGDNNSISSAVRNKLDDIAKLVPIAGKNRFATSVEIYKYGMNKSVGWSRTAIFAYGNNFPDALAIGPLAAYKRMPIFLVDGDRLSDNVKSVFTKAYFYDAIIVGSKDSVSDKIAKDIKSIIGKDALRLGGKDRYDTAAQIAKHSVAQGLSYDGAGVATGQKFPDALSGASLLSKRGAVLLLASGNNTSVLNLLKGKTDITKVHIFGDSNSVGKNIHRLIETHLSWPKGTIK